VCGISSALLRRPGHAPLDCQDDSKTRIAQSRLKKGNKRRRAAGGGTLSLVESAGSKAMVTLVPCGPWSSSSTCAARPQRERAQQLSLSTELV
jgi:hypothetical protein